MTSARQHLVEDGSPEAVLAGYAASARVSDFPVEAVGAARVLLADAVACVMAGLASPGCRRLCDTMAGPAAGSGGASLAGRAEPVAPAAAAMLNAALGHWFEWDDVYDPAALHPGMVIWPVILATAESQGFIAAGPDAAEVLVAAMVAYDVAALIGDALVPHLGTWLMPTGVACTIGAAAGAARLAGLDAGGIRSAMGLAAAGIGLSRQPLEDRVSGKAVLCAQAASRSMEAVALARAGVEGAPGFLFGRFGLACLTGAGAPQLAALVPGFAVRGTSLKPWPSCRSTHPMVGIALGIREMHDLDPADVRQVEIDAPAPMAAMCGRPYEPGPDPRVSAQFSIAWCVAVALLRGTITLEDMTSGLPGRNGSVEDLASRIVTRPVSLAAGARILGSPVTVRILTRSGSVLSRTDTRVPGSPAWPMSAAAAAAKLAAAGGPPGQGVGLAAVSGTFDAYGLAPVTAALRAATAPPLAIPEMQRSPDR